MLSGDDRIKARKGPNRPIIPENDRAQMLLALRVVDYVFIDSAKSPPEAVDPVHAEIVAKLQPDLYATDGPDPRFWNIMKQSNLIILSRLEVEGHASTSAIIKHILELENDSWSASYNV